MKHTKGEWKFDGMECIINENGLVIADISPAMHRNYDEAEANAKLIAGSPLLLQMVIDLKDCIKRLTQDDVTQFDRDLEANWESEAHELLTKVCPDYYQNANEKQP